MEFLTSEIIYNSLKSENEALRSEYTKMKVALFKCRERFQYYVDHHNAKGDYDKARGNEAMVEMIDSVIGVK